MLKIVECINYKPLTFLIYIPLFKTILYLKDFFITNNNISNQTPK